jgi:hypothetical protein
MLESRIISDLRANSQGGKLGMNHNNSIDLCDISGVHGSEYEDYSFLGSSAM